MGHPQLIAQVCTDNNTADAIAKDKIKQHQSRAMNIRYFGFVTKET